MFQAGTNPSPQMTMSAQQKEMLGNQLEAELRRLLGIWFPRCVDREYGGFLCDFNYKWEPSGSQLKMIEYQARQTFAAAQSALHLPESDAMCGAALHGFRYLQKVMWDAEYGGWYRLLDRAGSPGEGATKHGHGSSYAIRACVACYELTGEEDALALAISAFQWLETHAHDANYGGYFVFYQRDGTPILSEGGPLGVFRDPLGTPIGFKDANTTSDLLKCFADLYRVWPDALLKSRLEELLNIVRDRFVVAPGLIHIHMHPDWTPLPDFVRYGQVLHSANHLIGAASVLYAGVDPVTAKIARSMVDHMLRVAWDPDKAGFSLAGSSFGLRHLDGAAIFVKDKRWWNQAEGMTALLAVAQMGPNQVPYIEYFVRLWNYVKTYVIDDRHGGWFASGLDSNPEARRWPKATMWRDASHEVAALLESKQILDTLPVGNETDTNVY